jgi:hypothetical protein
MYLDRQRADASSRLAGAELERLKAEDGVRRLDAMQRNASTQIEHRREIEAMIGNARTELEHRRGTERQLRAEETQLLNAVAAEQSRWSDLNARLDDLEQALTTR